jgi:Cytochrome c
MNHRLISILIILTASCKTKTNDLQTLDFKAFQLKTPPGWTIFKEKGIDSYVGGLTNGKDSMWFDYGWYSAEIDEDESTKHLYGQDTISGLIGIIQIPKTDGQGSIRLSIPHVNDKDKFNLGGYNIKGTVTILKIFKSIVFKESDITKNGSLTLAKFKNYPLGSGRTLYYSNCASCHHPTKYLTGPPLQDVLKERSNDWVYKFLTNRKSVTLDSQYKARVKEAGDIKCMEFNNMTKNDVGQVLSYIKGR